MYITVKYANIPYVLKSFCGNFNPATFRQHAKFFVICMQRIMQSARIDGFEAPSL